MALETIDTFEHDIRDEIKNKEATIGDIASASGDVGNIPVQGKNISPIITIVITLIILLISIGISYFGYIYYKQKINPAPNTSLVKIPSLNDVSLLPLISPLFVDAIGRSLSDIKKTPDGYELIISSTNSYSSVFAYMIKNENLYVEDLAKALNVERDTSTTTIPFLFSDVTINNQNMRVGKSASSTIVYAFINTNALVIASSTEAILSLRNDILH